MIIGITGGTGCGKTTLLEMLKKQGALVLDCDDIYHQLLKTDGQLLSAIEDRFPGTVENGILQRKKLGTIVFADPSALAELNRITHAAVKAEVLKRLTGELIAIDAIALFESGLAELCDLTVAVTAPTEARVRRLMAREGITEAYARSRIAAQPDNEWFKSKSDHTIENDTTPEEFHTKCLAFFHKAGIIKGEIEVIG